MIGQLKWLLNLLHWISRYFAGHRTEEEQYDKDRRKAVDTLNYHGESNIKA